MRHFACIKLIRDRIPCETKILPIRNLLKMRGLEVKIFENWLREAKLFSYVVHG